MSGIDPTSSNAGDRPDVGRRSRRCVLGAALTASGSIALAAVLSHLAATERSALRELRVAEQRLERHSLQLADPRSSRLLESLAGTRDELRVRLVEALGATRGRRDVEELGFRLDERPVPEAEKTVRLRLSLEGRLAHGAALLAVLDAVGEAAEPWPTETRGCLVQRLASDGVQIECAVDVLHWTELKPPRALPR